jgi:hypothetical protein
LKRSFAILRLESLAEITARDAVVDVTAPGLLPGLLATLYFNALSLDVACRGDRRSETPEH